MGRCYRFALKIEARFPFFYMHSQHNAINPSIMPPLTGLFKSLIVLYNDLELERIKRFIGLFDWTKKEDILSW